MNKNILIVGGVLLAVSAGFAYVLWGGNGVSVTPNTSTTTERVILNENDNPAYTIEAVSYDEWRSYMPSLDRAVAFSASVPENARRIIQDKVELYQAKLKSDATHVPDWLDLAIQYHTANDYEGAREVWEFLVKAIPNDPIAYENLGKLYHFDLKDYERAEYYFKQSLTLNPENITMYYELHTLYAYSYKQSTTLAVDILESAAKEFPLNPDPLTQLGAYWREKGNYDKAREAYLRALDRARELNNVGLIDAIGSDLSKLPAP